MDQHRIFRTEKERAADGSIRATAQSAFFNVLPPELRISILTAAFGGRTVHIQPCQPEQPPQRRVEADVLIPEAHPGGLASAARRRLRGLFLARAREDHLSGASPAPHHRQKWCGRTCCRGRGRGGPAMSPAEDDCLGESDDHMRRQQQQQQQQQQQRRCACAGPRGLSVGAVGWLLSCRRAYDEGFEVLYGSNTFHVRPTSFRVFGGLVPRIPAAILSRITSVEIVMEEVFISYREFGALPAADRDEAEMLRRTLSGLPGVMPRLQKLYFGLFPGTCLLEDCEHGNGLEYQCTEYIARLMEAIALEYGRMGRPCHLELGLPSTPFGAYHHDAVVRGHRMGFPDWKPDSPSKHSYYPRHRIFQPAVEQGPETAIKNDQGGGPDVGYWISMTRWDGLRPDAFGVGGE